jgi:pimeloyl-ACP methyl ester carboxylesterase
MPSTINTAALVFTDAETAAFARYGVSGTSRFLALEEPGLRVRLLESGEGPPVLLIPGDGAVASAWAPLIAELPGFRSIVLDRPSFGLGDPFDYTGADLRTHAVTLLRSLLDALGLEAVPIIGSSGGAAWSLWLALDDPQRVTALASMGAPGVCLPGFRASAAMRLLTLPLVGRALAGMPSPSVHATGRMLAMTDACFADHPEIVAAYHAAKELPGYNAGLATVFQRSMRPGGRPRHANVLSDEDLAAISRPALFTWGADEPYGPPAMAERAASLMPDACVEVVPGGWHHPWLADPRGVGASVTRFLTGVRPTGSETLTDA